MEDSGKKIPDQLAGGKGEMINLELETRVTGKSLLGRLGFQVEILVHLGSMRDHGLAAEGGIEAAWDPTEHQHPEVQPGCGCSMSCDTLHDIDRRGRNRSLSGPNKYAH